MNKCSIIGFIGMALGVIIGSFIGVFGKACVDKIIRNKEASDNHELYQDNRIDELRSDFTVFKEKASKSINEVRSKAGLEADDFRDYPFRVRMR